MMLSFNRLAATNYSTNCRREKNTVAAHGQPKTNILTVISHDRCLDDDQKLSCKVQTAESELAVYFVRSLLMEVDHFMINNVGCHSFVKR